MSLKANTSVIQIVTLTITKMGQSMFYIVFVAFQGDIVPKNCAASAFSIIKAVGVSGGVVGPFLIGRMKEAFGGYSLTMYVLSAFYAISAILFFQARCYLKRAPSSASVSQLAPVKRLEDGDFEENGDDEMDL